MKLRPVKHLTEPKYPSKARADAHPELLQLVPRRWRNHPAVLSTLAAVSVAGCKDGGAKANADAASFSTHSTTPSVSSEMPQKPPGPLAKVAPIFEHGAGLAGTGGIAATRIIFLTEDQAQRVIVDEANKAGVRFKAGGKTLDRVERPITNPYEPYELRRKGSPNPKVKLLPVSKTDKVDLDGTEGNRDISFEYVSKTDFEAWKQLGQRVSTRTTYDMRGTAEVLREGIQKTGAKGVYGVFYDPLARYRLKPDNKGSRDKNPVVNTDSEKLLRAQVRDFLKWLRAEGVI